MESSYTAPNADIRARIFIKHDAIFQPGVLKGMLQEADKVARELPSVKEIELVVNQPS